jgi:hypothetical protein
VHARFVARGVVVAGLIAAGTIFAGPGQAHAANPFVSWSITLTSYGGTTYIPFMANGWVLANGSLSGWVTEAGSPPCVGTMSGLVNRQNGGSVVTITFTSGPCAGSYATLTGALSPAGGFGTYTGNVSNGTWVATATSSSGASGGVLYK